MFLSIDSSSLLLPSLSLFFPLMIKASMIFLSDGWCLIFWQLREKSAEDKISSVSNDLSEDTISRRSYREY